MFEDKDKIVIVQDIRDSKSKSEHIKDYVDSLKAIEECMEPYKEQKRDLKSEYVEKKWLTKEDISLFITVLKIWKTNHEPSPKKKTRT